MNSIPAEAALLISSSSACEYPAPPQLLFSTRMFAPSPNAFFAWIANSIARIAFATLPLPVESRKASPIIVVVQTTPDTPALLLPAAPAVPATAVPCVALSLGSQLFVMALYPWLPAGQVILSVGENVTVNSLGALHTLAARSGWV